MPSLIQMLPFFFFTRELYPDQRDELKKLRSHLIASSSELAALKVWELQGILKWLKCVVVYINTGYIMRRKSLQNNTKIYWNFDLYSCILHVAYRY